jgi:hypothetical protein
VITDQPRCVTFQVEANREGGAYNADPDFMSFVSLATLSAHTDGARFVIVIKVGVGVGDGREGGLAGPLAITRKRGTEVGSPVDLCRRVEVGHRSEC